MKKHSPSNTAIDQFFAYTQMAGKTIVRLGELQKNIYLSKNQEYELLRYLTNKGTILRLMRGVYLVPERIPPGGRWQPNSNYVINSFMEVIAAKYYIGGTYAFNHYGLTEQIPNIITVYNDKVSGQKQLGKLTVQFIKTNSKRIDNTKIITTSQGVKVQISSLARTIVDAVADYHRFNTLPKAYEWIKANLEQPQFIANLIKATVNYGNVSTRRRIGYTLEKYTTNKKVAKPILKTIKPTQSWVPLDPYKASKGKTNKTWRIIDNVSSQ